jgi:hypothetical protein
MLLRNTEIHHHIRKNQAPTLGNCNQIHKSYQKYTFNISLLYEPKHLKRYLSLAYFDKNFVCISHFPKPHYT